MKKLLLPLCMSISLFGFSIDSLQNRFYTDVIEKNIFKQHYQAFINKECQLINEECVDKTIKRLKTWESTQKNRFLQYQLKERSNEVFITPTQADNIKAKVKEFIQKKELKTSQFITLVNLQLQRLTVLFYDASSNELNIIGTDLISTGNMEKEKDIAFGDDHYLKTPTGVYENIKGWRSDGKYNEEKGIRGYGREGRFVFYFGRQSSVRYNTFDENREKIQNPKEFKLIKDDLEFAMHSHESSKKMGEANSHGCIRTTHELNLFLDQELILHQNNIKNSKWSNLSKAPKNFEQKNYSGKYVLIVDKI